MELEQAVGTAAGGGARAGAVRKVLTTNPGLTYQHMAETDWKKALEQLYEEFTRKYGERPSSMVARLGELRFRGKGHEDEKSTDYCRRAASLYEQYVECNEKLGSVAVYGRKTAINNTIKELTYGLGEEGVKDLQHNARNTKPPDFTFAWLFEQVEDQQERMEEDEECIGTAQSLVQALPAKMRVQLTIGKEGGGGRYQEQGANRNAQREHSSDYRNQSTQHQQGQREQGPEYEDQSQQALVTSGGAEQHRQSQYNGRAPYQPIREQQQGGGRGPMTRETAPQWLQPMWIEQEDVTPQFMDRQPRSGEQTTYTNRNGGRQQTGCCNHRGCKARVLGQCRFYKLYCLDRLGDVHRAHALKLSGDALLSKEDVPWLGELERRRKLGEPYVTHEEFMNRASGIRQDGGQSAGGGAIQYPLMPALIARKSHTGQGRLRNGGRKRTGWNMGRGVAVAAHQ